MYICYTYITMAIPGEYRYVVWGWRNFDFPNEKHRGYWMVPGTVDPDVDFEAHVAHQRWRAIYAAEQAELSKQRAREFEEKRAKRRAKRAERLGTK